MDSKQLRATVASVLLVLLLVGLYVVVSYKR